MTVEHDDRVRRNGARDPWANAPTGELGDQVLPRWFVLTAIGAVVAAVVVAVIAFRPPGRASVPVEARRPPASSEYTTAVGGLEVGGSGPVAYDAACGLLDGLRLAGADGDRAQLQRGLAVLCDVALPVAVASDVRAFAADGGVVRFATFEATGVDSTASRTDADPTIFVNTRFQRTPAAWIAPLIAHDATLLQRDPTTAAAAIAARRAEAEVCDRLQAADDQSRACADARAVLSLDDPAAALRAAGFR